jgi:cell division protein FtsB
MQDIGNRIRRYRLSRYAAPSDPVRRRLRWILPALLTWLLWTGFISDHSFYRLWQLERENARAQVEQRRVGEETRRLEVELKNPEALRNLAERTLREKDGMAKPGEIVYRIKGAAADTLGRD